MALIPGTVSDRLAAVRLLAAPFQENTGANGVSASIRRWRQAVSTRRMPTWSIPASLNIGPSARSEEHTSELQSRENLVCRLLLEKKNHMQKGESPVTVDIQLQSPRSGLAGRHDMHTEHTM